MTLLGDRYHYSKTLLRDNFGWSDYGEKARGWCFGFFGSCLPVVKNDFDTRLEE
jgi:hypothetical protein